MKIDLITVSGAFVDRAYFGDVSSASKGQVSKLLVLLSSDILGFKTRLYFSCSIEKKRKNPGEDVHKLVRWAWTTGFYLSEGIPLTPPPPP